MLSLRHIDVGSVELKRILPISPRMKIEKEWLQLQALQLSPSQDGGTLTLLTNHKTYRLNGLHYSYCDVLRNCGTIEGLVQFFLGQGWLVSFRELFILLQFLVSENILLNPSFQEYFLKTSPHEFLAQPSNFDKKLASPLNIQIQDLPFFRSLEPQLAAYLLQKTERIQVPAQMALTRSGQRDRDLFVMLKGEAAIYRVLDEKRRQMISVMGPGSIFGEFGFLLNQPRSADVITRVPSEILRVHHLPEFDQFIKTEKAHNLQQRFWALQALHSSPFFKDLPTDSLDGLIFSGRLCQLPAHQVLFREGNPGNTCYIIIQGNVVVSQNGKNINTQGQGTCFGEISLLMSQGQRTATVTSQQDSILLEIQQNDFYRVLSQNLILAKEIESLAAQRLVNDANRRR